MARADEEHGPFIHTELVRAERSRGGKLRLDREAWLPPAVKRPVRRFTCTPQGLVAIT